MNMHEDSSAYPEGAPPAGSMLERIQEMQLDRVDYARSLARIDAGLAQVQALLRRAHREPWASPGGDQTT